MTFETYRQLTGRTMPDLGSLQLNVLHMMLGMTSEFTEIIDCTDKINLGEEMGGDTAWYCSNYANLMDLDVSFPLDIHGINKLKMSFYDRSGYFLGGQYSYVYLQSEICKLVDLEKKRFVYNKEVSKEELQERLQSILDHMSLCLHAYGIDPFQAMDRNIAKLKIRFPEKFTEDNAKNRDLDSERQALES